MPLNDRTEIRNAKTEKDLWVAAAVRKGKKLATWIRETLTAEASEIVSSSPPADAA